MLFPDRKRPEEQIALPMCGSSNLEPESGPGDVGVDLRANLPAFHLDHRIHAVRNHLPRCHAPHAHRQG